MSGLLVCAHTHTRSTQVHASSQYITHTDTHTHTHTVTHRFESIVFRGIGTQGIHDWIGATIGYMPIVMRCNRVQWFLLASCDWCVCVFVYVHVYGMSMRSYTILSYERKLNFKTQPCAIDLHNEHTHLIRTNETRHPRTTNTDTHTHRKHWMSSMRLKVSIYSSLHECVLVVFSSYAQCLLFFVFCFLQSIIVRYRQTLCSMRTVFVFRIHLWGFWIATNMHKDYDSKNYIEEWYRVSNVRSVLKVIFAEYYILYHEIIDLFWLGAWYVTNWYDNW